MLKKIGLKEGIYIGVLGPAYETPAEATMLGLLGGHAVGMSTVQEALAARQLGLTVAGLSFITNVAGGGGTALSHQEVLELARENSSRLADVLTEAIGVGQ